MKPETAPALGFSTVPDGIGGQFIVDVAVKRASVGHRDALGKSKSLAAFYGESAGISAMEWITLLLSKRGITNVAAS